MTVLLSSTLVILQLVSYASCFGGEYIFFLRNRFQSNKLDSSGQSGALALTCFLVVIQQHEYFLNQNKNNNNKNQQNKNTKQWRWREYMFYSELTTRAKSRQRLNQACKQKKNSMSEGRSEPRKTSPQGSDRRRVSSRLAKAL